MKKFIAGLSALALAGMMTMSVSADTTIAPDPDNMPAPKPGSAGLEVSYDVSPTYTVTIPAAVELSPTETQTKNITATDVKLEQGAKIVVTLDSASNTESGSTFNAKIGDSTANYTISAGGANVEVGGKVAEFDTKDGDQSAALTFSKAEGATYAGKHTEQLTFGIAVKDAAAEPAAPAVLKMVTITNSDYPKKTINNTNLDPIDTGLVTVTFDNKGDNCGNDHDENGWYFYGNNATLTVTPSKPDMEIAKVVFYTKNGSAELTNAPFTVYSYFYSMYTAPNRGGTCFNDWGITKIEVYYK